MSNTSNYNLPTFKFLFIPILIEQLFHLLLANVDVLMLSQYSDQAVTAVGLANQYISIGVMIYGFVNIGLSIVLNQLSSVKDWPKINRYITQAFIINIVLVVVMTITFVFGAELLLRFINVPEESFESAKQYLSIIGMGMIFQSGIACVTAIYRSFSYVKTVMIIMIVMNMLNIILNYIVLFTPTTLFGFGVSGVAHATNISKFLGLILLLMIFFRVIQYKLTNIDLKKLLQLLKLGIPSAGEHVSFNLSQLLMTRFIAVIGFTAITAKIYVQTISAFIFVISLAISQATQILVGKMIGLDLRYEARDKVKRTMFISCAVSALLAFILFLCGRPIAEIFTDDDDIIQTVTTLLLLTVLLEPFRCANVMLVSVLNSYGEVRYPVLINVIISWIVVIPLTYIGVVMFHFSIFYVWWVFIIDEAIRAILMYRKLNQNVVIEKRIL